MSPHPFDLMLLTSRYIVQDRWLKVRADTYELPNAQVIEPYYVLEYPTWLNIVALTAQEEVVLVRLYRHGIRQTVLELPSGAVESSDASVLDATRRELLEETGYGGGAFCLPDRLRGTVETGPPPYDAGFIQPQTGGYFMPTHGFSLANNMSPGLL